MKFTCALALIPKYGGRHAQSPEHAETSFHAKISDNVSGASRLRSKVAWTNALLSDSEPDLNRAD